MDKDMNFNVIYFWHCLQGNTGSLHGFPVVGKPCNIYRLWESLQSVSITGFIHNSLHSFHGLKICSAIGSQYLVLLSNPSLRLLRRSKQNHKIAGITNCKITQCGDPLYLWQNFAISLFVRVKKMGSKMHLALNFLPSSADVFDRHLMRTPRKTAIGILIVYCSYNILLQTEILMYVCTVVLDT